MIEEPGFVRRIEGSIAWVETQRKSTCDQCSAKNYCGQRVLDSLQPNQGCQLIAAAFDMPLQEGDKVVVGIAEEQLLLSSLWVYLMPLLLMMLGLLIASTLSLSEPLTILLSFVALGLGFVGVRKYSNRLSKDPLKQARVMSKCIAVH